MLAPKKLPPILLVEDSETSTAIVTRYLRRQYHVLRAADGEEAWRTLSLNPDIELVLTNAQIPRLNGHELLRKIRGSRRAAMRNLKILSSRGSAISRWWSGVRYRLAAGKYLLISASLAGAVLAAFGFLLHSAHAARVDGQNLTCLALNVYYEARGEPRAGKYAVAEVTLNRVASPRYPDTVCSVVYQKNWDWIRKRYVAAFSWTEFNTLPEPQGPQWTSAREIAEEVYYRRKAPTLADALYYHAKYIRPSWSREKTRVAQIGNHVFYR